MTKSFFPLGLLTLAAATFSCGTTQPNLIARGMNVTWDGTRHTVDAFVWNQRRSGPPPSAASAFFVYIDPEETPVSNRNRPQISADFDSLDPEATAPVAADFTPLAVPSNAHLANVRSITLRADPKLMVEEADETDNILETPLPGAIGATMIHGPSLVPLGHLALNAGRRVGQVFTAPVTGSIVGLEITASRCSQPSTIPLRLVLMQGATTLATASIPTGSFSASCVGFPPPISGVVPGPGFFDLRTTPVPIVAGDLYAFELHNDMTSGMFRVGMTSNVIPGSATDFGIAVPGVDLTFKLFIHD